MFQNTRAVLYDIVHDLRTFFRFFSVLSQILYIAYLSYTVICNIGIIYVNAVLLTLSAIYFIVDVIITIKSRKQKQKAKTFKRSLRYAKLGINAFNIGVAIYGVYLTANNANAVTVVLTAAMLIFWIIKVILEIITYFVEHRIELVIAGFNKDIEPITKTIHTIKKFVGAKDEESKPISSKISEELKKALDQFKEHKKNKNA